MRYKILIAIILSVVVCSYVSAEPRSSTPEEYQKALSYSVNALRKTDNYLSSLMDNSTFDDLLNKINLCENELKILENIHSQKTIGGKEARVCMLAAIIILQERYLALANLRNAVYAGAKGDYDANEKYSNKAHQYMDSSAKLRQEFKATYGY